MLKNPRLRCVHVKANKAAVIPKGFSIQHTVLIEPTKGSPYFAVLLTDEKRPEEKNSAIGFNLDVNEE